ncbi:MAG: hypothetical protein CMI79_06710 [Candidatus Pelagibacter sp.]|nr:hypothetical protein [Candidatus Pelagibacter sp.]
MPGKTAKIKKHSGNKTKKVHQKMKPTCSPAKSKSAHKDTCYTSEALQKMKNLWNARHKHDKITTNDNHKIWQALRDRFTGVCDTEKCWMRQKFAANKLGPEITSYTFAPNAPLSWKNNPNEWLNSLDIIAVMKHFEKAYPRFAFIGPSPIDFDTHLMYGDCVWEELCRFDLKNMLRKRKKIIGVIFNTDPHTKDGEHWVSLIINMQSKPHPYIFYFDSNGDPVKDEIMIFANRVIKQGENLGYDIKFYQNHPKEHQMEDSECGVYSLYMITQILSGEKTYRYFIDHSISDAEMEKFRHVYFDHSNNIS